MTVLKSPIDLNSLKVEYEGKPKKKVLRKREFDETKLLTEVKKEIKIGDDDNGNEKTFQEETKIGDEDKMRIMWLKEPISVNIDWKEDKAVTYKVKTIKGAVQRHSIIKSKEEHKKAEQNALTLFDNSFIYPFVHASDKYKCFICSKSVLDPKLLRDHTTKEHTVKEMKVAVLNKIREKNLKVDVSNLQCKICLMEISDLQALKVHLKEHGKNIDPDLNDCIIPFRLEGSTFDCQLCNQSFLKLRLLIIHMSEHFNNYSCEVCGSMFISLKLLKRHLQTHETGSFPCSKCDKVFANASKRSIHIRGVHLKQFPRRCPICPERFNSNYQRTKHLRVVHNQSNGLFRCETCGREYDLKYHLLVHIRSVHLRERNVECSICHSRFFSKYYLSRHMVIHTGDKSFKCEVCGKAYARMKNLREHSRTHEMAVPCAVCGKRCSEHHTAQS